MPTSNHDAHADVAVANNFAFTVTVLLGGGAGNFIVKGHFAAGEHPYSIAAGDFNLDGHRDVAVANRVGANNRLNILSGDGSGNLGARREFTVTRDDGYTYNGPSDVAVGDFNLDGKPDLVVTFQADAGISILLGDGAGDGNFTSNTTLSYNLQTPLNDIATGYFNDDGEVDLVAVDGFEDSQVDTGHATILLGTVGAGFVPAGSFSAHTTSHSDRYITRSA